MNPLDYQNHKYGHVLRAAHLLKMQGDIDRPNPKPGEVYTHYETLNDYRVVSTGLNVETKEVTVIYRKGDEFFTRSLPNFLGKVDVAGEKVYRFTHKPPSKTQLKKRNKRK